MSFNDLLILTMFQVFNLEAVIIKPPSTDLFSKSEFYPSVFSDISIELNFNQVNHRKPPPLPDLLSSQPSSELQFPNISEDLLQTVTHQDQSILKPPAPALYNTILEGQFLQDIGDPLHNRKCSPETQIAFAKTHKTGSSTMQNIFFRFGDKHNLTFSMPENSWMFSFKEVFNSSVVTNLDWAHLGYNIFTFHSIWDYNEVNKVIPNALHLTILRDPVNCYESNFVYMGLENRYRMKINGFAVKKIGNNSVPRRPKAIIGKNQQLWDLGLNHTDMEDEVLVDMKIEELKGQLDFVLIAEYFDESLVLLSQLLCWDLSEFRYLKQNARKLSKVSKINETARGYLKNWLRAEYKLYDYYVEVLEQKIEEYGREKMTRDVDILRSMNEDLRNECVIEVADKNKLEGEFKTALDIVEGYIIHPDKPWCAPFARTEPHYTTQLRNKQKLRATIIHDEL